MPRTTSFVLMLTLSCVINTQRVLAAKPGNLLPWSRVDASPDKSYELSEDNGPWMIYTAAFAGPTAEEEAKQLVLELRTRKRVEAYIHRKRFDFSDSVEGLGYDKYGNIRRMRYLQPESFDELAVLVGNFESPDSDDIKELLQELKNFDPNSIQIENGATKSLRFAGLRAIQKRLVKDESKKRRGPLGQSFITRNPMLPDELFAPKGVDKLVASMNEGVTHSLLDCPGKFTVRIASFRGTDVIDQRKIRQIEETGQFKSKLHEAADKAHRLTELLRARGEEAYEFHDRHESIVTVGHFDTLGSPRGDGKIEINPAVHSAIQRFSPVQKMLPGSNTQAGLMPRALGGIPFDIQPLPVEVPRRSIAADYATARGSATRGGAVR
ncbi:MAG: hypothetical protein KDA60_02925 [Planctomycetales bacterium]|nr:hypothetical protein [Planctomycetales bacterium]